MMVRLAVVAQDRQGIVRMTWKVAWDWTGPGR